MSTIKQLCPKCFSEVLKIKSVGEISVTFDISEDGQVIPSIIETLKDTEADFSQVECTCGHVTTIDQLAQGRQSSVSGKWYPIEHLVAWTNEQGEEMIGTQEELDSLTAPSLEQMDEEQLREHAKKQDETISSLQEQMNQLMAMMQQMQTAPAAEEKAKPAPKAKPTPKAEPAQEEQAVTVETNIPSPNSDESFEVVEGGGEPNSGEFEVINIEGEDNPDDEGIFGDEAPF